MVVLWLMMLLIGVVRCVDWLRTVAVVVAVLLLLLLL